MSSVDTSSMPLSQALAAAQNDFNRALAILTNVGELDELSA